MKQRSELYSIFKSFYMEIKTQFNVSLHIFQSDNVHEYFHTSLSQFFYDHGIIHQSSCPHTPQQNGVAERKMHHLLEVTRALKLHMRIPKSYWSDVVLTICLLIIVFLPLFQVVRSLILCSLLMHICFIYLLIFLVVCYVHILGPRSNKLDPRSIKYVFLGYSHTQKGYQCYSSTLRHHFISADVTFDESQSYFSPSVASDNSPPYLPLLPHVSH